MESKLKFIDFNSDELSDCGQVLDIEFSNRELDWPGVILEKGSSPHFYPKNVYTPYFYFALALEQDLNWTAETNGSLVSLKTTPGDVWINPPKTPFSHDISEPCYFVILAIEEEAFLSSCPLSLEGKDLQFLNNYNVPDETIKEIIKLFILEVQAKGRNGHLYLQNLLSLLSTHYIQNYSNYVDQKNIQVDSSKFEQRHVDKVDQYIEDNIGTTISVDDLAELLNCSKFYFLREFKKLIGLTPYQYLMNKRLDQAKHLLSLESVNIALVGQELGFNDQSHFTRTFKNRFNMTPGQFVKQHNS
ncbi:AraC family transcriptional regulator [Vibrio sp. D404a]|uniref:helix-turn-helix domain-containing protein n=2 Tax=Vibrio TaxID=662 RepID=UPI0025527FCF|nr:MULTISPECIES: AraC family transcriptional regulator [unclassified Vibrio]MDK9739440.1 AraC family transcriptional regulator [Vibrio sp. D404a]MDK9798920.1 AraC family transcriptional regulator [Vibrio sp. D449a]